MRGLVVPALLAFGLGSCFGLFHREMSPREKAQVDVSFLTGKMRIKLGGSPWARDGQSLVTCVGEKLLRVQVDGGAATPLTEDPAWEANFSPDGRWIAYNLPPSLLLEDYGKHRLSWLSEDGRDLRSIDLFVDETVWSPDGRWIAATHWIMRREGSSAQDPRVFLVSTESGDWTDIGLGEMPAWSPDGTRIACAVPEGSWGGWIEIMNPDGSGRVRLTSGKYPCWSRDGRYLAFLDSDGERASVVFTIALDGSERRALGEGFLPSWSPTDDRLLYTRLDQDQPLYTQENDERALVAVRRDGSEELVLARSGWGGRWSPDGSRIAFLRHPFSHELVVVNADGSGERSLGDFSALASAKPSEAALPTPRE